MSPRTGRPPVENPKNIKMNIRISEETAKDLQECADFTGIPGQGAGDREMILIVPVVVWLVLPHQQSNVRRTVCTDIAQIYGGPLHINIAYRHGNQVGNRSVEVVAPIDGFSFCHAKIHALIELNVNHPFHLHFL